MFLKIFDSGIMYYVVMPLAIVFLGWAKNEHDTKQKNVELGYWMMKCKRLDGFDNIALCIYKKLAIDFLVMQIVRLGVFLWKGNLISYIVSGVLYFFVGALIIIFTFKNVKTKVEFWKNGKEKRILIILLYLIYGTQFLGLYYEKYTGVAEILFIVEIISWMYFLYKYSDVEFILDNRYADIYVKGSEKAAVAEAGSIKKQGEWIIVKRYVNGYEEELRIRERGLGIVWM